MTSKSEEHLSAQELDERFELLADTAHEYAIFLIDPDGRIICWNPGASRLFGYQSDEVVGQHFSLLFSPEDVQSGRPDQELKISRATGRAENFRWQRRKGGARFWCSATLTPLYDENKQVRSLARVMHDLSDGQALEGQTRRADDLAAANRSKEDFMALLSHELRNPLGPILDALSIQREVKTADPILQQAGHVIERQVGQMVRLVDDLLDVSRITTGKLRLTKQAVELRVIVNDAVEASRHSVDARRHEFSVALPTEPIWVDADPARLEQVFVNLLNNASKYTGPGGLIRVTVDREASEGVVRVQDNGAGIAAEMLPHIFELFTQVDATVGRSRGGLGIGLALVGTLVEMHNGRVQAASAGLSKGSEFTVRLPTIANPPESVFPSQAAMVLPTGAGPRVLIVEDDIDAGDMLCMLLRLKGHEVFVARSGQTALEAVPTFLPDVVLCDVGLPGMDGYEVARRLRETPECKDKLLCALTGYTPSAADDRRLPLAGFDHHFVKPVVIDTLLALFKTLGS